MKNPDNVDFAFVHLQLCLVTKFYLKVFWLLKRSFLSDKHWKRNTFPLALCTKTMQVLWLFIPKPNSEKSLGTLPLYKIIKFIKSLVWYHWAACQNTLSSDAHSSNMIFQVIPDFDVLGHKCIETMLEFDTYFIQS